MLLLRCAGLLNVAEAVAAVKHVVRLFIVRVIGDPEQFHVALNAKFIIFNLNS